MRLNGLDDADRSLVILTLGLAGASAALILAVFFTQIAGAPIRRQVQVVAVAQLVAAAAVAAAGTMLTSDAPSTSAWCSAVVLGDDGRLVEVDAVAVVTG